MQEKETGLLTLLYGPCKSKFPVFNNPQTCINTC